MPAKLLSRISGVRIDYQCAITFLGYWILGTVISVRINLGFWKILKPLIDPVVASKIFFLKPEEIVLHLDPSQLLSIYPGGQDQYVYEYIPAPEQFGKSYKEWILEKPSDDYIKKRQEIFDELDKARKKFESATIHLLHAMEKEAAGSGSSEENGSGRRPSFNKRSSIRKQKKRASVSRYQPLDESLESLTLEELKTLRGSIKCDLIAISKRMGAELHAETFYHRIGLIKN